MVAEVTARAAAETVRAAAVKVMVELLAAVEAVEGAQEELMVAVVTAPGRYYRHIPRLPGKMLAPNTVDRQDSPHRFDTRCNLPSSRSHRSLSQRMSRSNQCTPSRRLEPVTAALCATSSDPRKAHALRPLGK